ncbi:MBL fold metallo-hydrolase [Chryseobacterium sp. ERMR1:04]|uniref:MBL fold metallo-hydrolase n=1 Tax=Chryseobacterium sp. ERMR1:04 TaxID=1705393 RepID=UPI0006C8C0F2|nr:MBL fold metallo-hydrolase [Chryseobacterium sp. ERMR1:04]KPH12904.1 beta-lactamase [Chryseobacterium sp. ERMR1:04]
MKQMLKRIFLVIFVLFILTSISGFMYIQPQFGKLPSGERLERIKKSPHFKNGEFHNFSDTPTITDGHSFWGEIYEALFKKNPNATPNHPLPNVKTDLKNLPNDQDYIVWFGHSSTLLHLNGKNILTDPVFSDNASPIPSSVLAFKGTTLYSVDDLPEIDYIVISHDHYDHLDYKTIKALQPKVKKVICGLGVGEDFEYWGYPKDKIIELDWFEKYQDPNGELTFNAEPSRHQSGRGLTQNQTLWASYVIQSKDKNYFVSGDGGFDKHFEQIGNKYKKIDLAIMEDGQYDKAWHFVHNLPNEIIQASKNLHAKRILPYHNSKFNLAKHDWNTPLNELTTLAKKEKIPVLTPKIGEVVYPNDTLQRFTEWWKK